MRKTISIPLLAALLFGVAATPSFAFNQPPLNLGLTDILDGALPGPGTYFTEYIQAYQSDKFKDHDGKLHPRGPEGRQRAFDEPVRPCLQAQDPGGHLGADVLLPVVAISGSGTVGSPGPPVSTNPAVLGDLVVGPFLQWFDTKLLGRPFFQRVELDFILPTGQYDNKYLINPGSNLWTIEPYYAFTWFLTPQFSTSWRIHYTYNTKNTDPFEGLGVSDVQPGQAFHFNYSFEYEFFKNFRGAVAGYYLKQLSDDKVNGNSVADTKEQVFAVGPAVSWAASPNFFLGLKTQWESSAENRPEGNRTTFRMTYKF